MKSANTLSDSDSDVLEPILSDGECSSPDDILMWAILSVIDPDQIWSNCYFAC